MKQQKLSHDRFGDIEIKPESAIPSHIDDDGIDFVGPATGQDHNERSATPVVQVPHVDKGGRRHRPDHSGLRKILFWMLLPFALAVLYGVSSFFFIPALIKGPLARKVSERIDRPIHIKRVVFSPFTLRLMFNGISIGAVPGDQISRELLSCSHVEGSLRIASLSRRRLELRDLQIKGLDLRLVRFQDGTYNLARIYKLLVPKTDAGQLITLPHRLVVNGIKMTNSRIELDDRISGRRHRVEQVRFLLPPLSGHDERQELMPQLNAVMNGSPIQIKGVRRRTEDGSFESRARLSFKKVSITDYLGYLTKKTTKFSLSDGLADCDLELVFPGEKSRAKGFFLRGDVTFRALRMSSRDGSIALKIPLAKVTAQFSPLTKQYWFKDVVLSKPELTLPGAQQGAGPKADFSMADVGAFLKAPAYGLKVDRFLVDQGRVRLHHENKTRQDDVWREVHFSITDFVTAAYSVDKAVQPRTSPYLFEGVGRDHGHDMKISIRGHLNPELKTDGRVSVKNIILHPYQSFLPDVPFNFSKGRADFNSLFEFSALSARKEHDTIKGRLRLHDGTLVLKDFAIVQQKRKLLAGQKLECGGLQVDIESRQFSCDRLHADKNEIFSGSWQGQVLKPSTITGKWQVKLRKIEVEHSLLHTEFFNHVPGGRGLDVVLSDLSLQAVDSGPAVQPQDNISATARVGKKGRLNIHGYYNLEKHDGRLRIDLKDMALSSLRPLFSSWFMPDDVQGMIHARGSVIMPAQKFNGMVWLEDFSAGSSGDKFIRWQEALASSVSLTLKPFDLVVEDVVVKKPQVMADDHHHPEKGGDRFFRLFQHQDERAPRKTCLLKNIRIEAGRGVLPHPALSPGYYPELQEITGTLSPVQPPGPITFSLSGQIKGRGGFRIKGTTGLTEIHDYTLDVKGMPLVPFQKMFSRMIGADVQQAQGQWHQTYERTKKGGQLDSSIQIKGMRPQPGSEFGGMVSLLIDDNDTLSIHIAEGLVLGRSLPLLFNSTIRRLQYQQVKAAVSPRLVLRETLPNLDLPERILFVPGKAELLHPQLLTGYQVLFQKRPYVGLVLTGSFDAKQDEAVLHNVLQHEAERRRTAENQRRAAERSKIDASEKARLAAIPGGSSLVESEKISTDELKRDLQPLPPVAVRVSSEMLHNLAYRRLDAVRSYLIDNLLIDKMRIVGTEAVREGGAGVDLTLVPVSGTKRREGQQGHDHP